jgi:hypothetical protein
MTLPLLTLFLAPPVAFTLWNLHCYYRNYLIARRIGIPIKFLIASGDNPVWVLVSGLVLPVLKFVFGDCDLITYNTPGWENKNRYKMHEELGDAVIQVSAGRNWLYISDAEAASDIFKRNKDFDRPPDLLGWCFPFCFFE